MCGREVTEGCRELHYEKLHNVSSSPDIIRMTKDKMGDACSAHGEIGNEYIFVAKHKRK
jgi:hypothetical protein